ncbi:MAG: hypothetical protein IT348_11655 [Candidatus Eisenbacteria bacterium]|nr:hypothetical protein [Candidatus Eisenbacteria bacterium]
MDLLDGAIATMAGDIADRAQRPGLYSNIESAQLRSFAEAMALFSERRPWLHLSAVDVIQIEAPSGARHPAWFTVNGGSGVHFGLIFVYDRRDLINLFRGEYSRSHLDQLEIWSVGFVSGREMPLSDVRRWKQDALPISLAGRLPHASRQLAGGELALLTSKQLAHVEAAIRAVSLCTEDELDTGRWERLVVTSEGDVTVRLAVPALLEEEDDDAGPLGPPMGRELWRNEATMREISRLMSEQKFESPDHAELFLQQHLLGRVIEPREPETPRERAEAMVQKANLYQDRRRTRLARRALSEWPDCADAYVILAQDMPDDERAVELYRQGVAAGERAMGSAMLAEHAGHFWGALETRPYMRALAGLAQTLIESGNRNEGVALYRELLRLNPADNQGIRTLLIPELLGLSRYAEAREVLAEFAADYSAGLQWSRALVEFAECGDSPGAQEALAVAMRANTHVLKYLVGSSPLPRRLPSEYRPGGDDEAQIAAAELLKVYEAVPGSLEWLRAARLNAKKAGKAKRRAR